jgi:hypothetical protein
MKLELDIELSAHVVNGELVAHLSFVNNTENRLYLDEQTVCYNNRIRGDFFKIKNEKGKEVDYTGMKVCRDIDPELFIKLNSGEKLETDINLSEVYEIKKGKKYTIHYSTYHPSYLKEQELTKIGSNEVEVVYK